MMSMASAQEEPYFVKRYPDSLHPKRLAAVIGGQAVVYATSFTLLYHAWYKNFPRSGWHWIDDNGEWMQMDKIGHATTSAYFGKFGYETYRWAGMERKKAIWIGGSAGFIFLTVIEIQDGFSEQWGASLGDLAANTFGTALFISQQLAWNDQRFNLKWSYHETKYPKYVPDQLGTSFMEKMLKTRTILLSGEINKQLAERVIRQLLLLEDLSDEPVRVFIDSPGGDADAGFAILDMMRFIKPPVTTIGMGLVASAGALILLAAPKEQRLGLPNSHYLIHQPLSGMRGVATDIEIHAREIDRMRSRINELISSETGKPIKQIEKDTDRDFWMNSDEALEYGLVSRIISSRAEVED